LNYLKWISRTAAVVFVFGLLAAASAQPYSEAPMLSEMVAAGELPALADRLPSNPMVITPIEEIGQYGGELRRALVGPGDGNGWRTIATDGLFEWAIGEATAIPSLAESSSANADNTVHTITLREGLHWSDGEPFTADDLVFYYEAVLQRDELAAVARNQGWKTVAGTGTEIVKVDDRTVEFHFGAPYALLQQQLAYYGDEMLIPRHYMSQYHPDFTSEDQLAQRIADAGLDDWTQLFIQKFNVFLNPQPRPAGHGPLEGICCLPGQPDDRRA
jgi:peptide/nickel transport system substrate-binding protein